MTGNVAEGFAHDREKLAGRIRAGFGHGTGDLQLEVDHRIVPKLVGQGGQPADQRGAFQELRAQAEDEVADVLDRQVDRVDGPLDPDQRFGSILVDQLGHVLEEQSDRVQVLDDSVVEVLGDPFALVDDGEALELDVKAGVLHRDPGVQRECLDQRLVISAEFVRAQPCSSGTAGRRWCL